MTPAVARRLQDNPGVPGEIREGLRRRRERIAVWNLHQVRGLFGVLDVFEEAGIEAMPFKGPVLAEKLHGGVGERQYRDVDVLVR